MARARQGARRAADQYVRDTAGAGGSAAEEIARGKELLDRRVITQEEFELLKANALA